MVTQLSKGRVEDGSLHACGIHEQATKEGLVEAPSDLLVVADVQPVAVLEEPQGDLEALLESLVLGAGQLDQSFGFSLLDSNRLLPSLQVGCRDGFSYVGVDQALAQLLQPLPASALSLEELFVSLSLGIDPYERGLSGSFDHLMVKDDILPMIHDLLLDLLGRQVRQVALGPLLDLAQAEEVGVGDAVSVLGVTEAET